MNESFQNRDEWNGDGEAFVQQSMRNGDDDIKTERYIPAYLRSNSDVIYCFKSIV